MAIQIHTDRRDGLVRLAVTGPVDLPAASSLRSVLAEAIEAGDPVVVDLAGVDFLDSSGINALVSAYRTGRSRGIPVRVVNALGVVRRTLEVVGVYHVLAGPEPVR